MLDLLFAGGLAGTTLWLALLTIGLLHCRRSRDEPVYRRLADGRLRFEWGVNAAYQKARRTEARGRPSPTRPSHRSLTAPVSGQENP